MGWTELGPRNFARCAPLIDDRSGTPYLLRAVLRGFQPGRVFVDDPGAPGAAFVLNRFGFSVLLGRETPEFREALAGALTSEGSLGARYVLWYAPPRAWAVSLDELVPDPVRRRQRIRFQFDRSQAIYADEPEGLPVGYTLSPLTAESLPLIAAFKLDIASRFWPSEKDFLAHGLGVVLFHGRDVASVCYSACVADGHAEIDVATAEEHRSRGLASLVGREFVRRCLKKGLLPAWDAFAENHGSVKLARALGFRTDFPYDFYSFTTPLPKVGA